MRIFTAGICHETSTMYPKPTTLDDFRLFAPVTDFGGGKKLIDHFRGTRTCHGGFIDEAARRALTVEPLLWTFPTPGGTVAQSAYEYLKNLLLERLKKAGACDGVYLDLHGAMVTEKFEDAEGDLVTSVRQVVGRDIPIVMTIDLHANVTRTMVDNTDVIIVFDYYPHTDMYERGIEAAAVIQGIIKKEIRPAVAFRQLPLVSVVPMQCSYREPMKSLISRMHAIEQEKDIVNAGMALGYPYADIHDVGMSVLVTANHDQDLAARKADELAHAIWAQRDAFTPKCTPIPEAIAYARQAKGLVVLADVTDNPGTGSPGDGTTILRELIEQKFEGAAVVCIPDPEAVSKAHAAGIGATLTLTVGGKTDTFHGAPLSITAQVRLHSDGWYTLRGPMGGGERTCVGKTAVLICGGVEIIVTERRFQPYDTAFPRSVGIEPTERKLVVVKSSVHFRNTYQEIAEKIFEIDTPGIHRPDFSCIHYRRARRPLYPIDRDATF
jgi:microcystin degradation protein MlrC